MGSEPDVVELSSSDEAENDDLMCLPWGMDSKRPLIGDDDDDDVVIIEKSQCTSTRTRERSTKTLVEAEDDDDCCVVADAPDTKVEVLHGDVEELIVTGESGPVACRDFPHARHLCVRFPFKDTPHEDYCEQCHCYVCDKLAPCGYWATHCHASDKEETWKVLRKSNKSPELALLSTVAQAGLIPTCPVPLPTTRPRSSATVRTRPTLSYSPSSSPPVTMSDIARSLARQPSSKRHYPQGTGPGTAWSSSTSTTMYRAPAAAVQTNTYFRPPMPDTRPRGPTIRFRPPTSDVRPANHIRPSTPHYATTRQNGSMLVNVHSPTGPTRIRVRGNSPGAVPCPQAKLKVLLSNHANQKVRIKKQARSASKVARTFVHGQHGLNAQVNIASSGFSVPQCSVSLAATLPNFTPPADSSLPTVSFGSTVPAPPTVLADSTVLPTTAPASGIANANGVTDGILFRQTSGERNMTSQETDRPEDNAETDKYLADLRALFELNQP